MWESNPPLRLERAVSLVDRRTSHRVGRGALESPSAGLQPAAGPSQLPAHSAIPTKRPGVLRHTGPETPREDVRGRASRPQGIERARTRRLFGGSLRSVTTQDVTRTTGEHGRPRCKRCLGPNRLGAGLGAWPVVLYSFRRRTPRGCSRDSRGLSSTGSFGGDQRRVERRSGRPATVEDLEERDEVSGGNYHRESTAAWRFWRNDLATPARRFLPGSARSVARRGPCHNSNRGR